MSSNSVSSSSVSSSSVSSNAMFFVVASNNRARIYDAAKNMGGTVFEETRTDPSVMEKLPCQILLKTVTDNFESLKGLADVGLYLVCERNIKARSNRHKIHPHTRHENNDTSQILEGVIGLFPMVSHPALGHVKSDAHWRDVHAPLALKSHSAMSHYRQLSVVHCFNGPAWDGIALCGFDTLPDLRERFFDSDEAKRAIGKDIAHMADTKKSPRRLLVSETTYKL
jgi:hypothetical protein